MIFRGRKPEPLFDDVASEEIKALRIAIRKQAEKALVAAGAEAALGNAKAADDLMETARVLRCQAIFIPLDMIEAKIDLKEHGTIIQFDAFGSGEP